MNGNSLNSEDMEKTARNILHNLNTSDLEILRWYFNHRPQDLKDTFPEVKCYYDWRGDIEERN